MKFVVILPIFLMLLSLKASAATMEVPQFEAELTTDLKIESLQYQVYCLTDKWTGKGDPEYSYSEKVDLELTPLESEAGYVLTFPEVIFEYRTFFRSFQNCGLKLLSFEGFNPEDDSKIKFDNEIIVGASDESKSDGSYLIEDVIQMLENYRVIANPASDSDESWAVLDSIE